MPLNFCPYCGTRLVENSKFCFNCGGAVPVAEESVVSESALESPLEVAENSTISCDEKQSDFKEVKDAPKSKYRIEVCGRTLEIDQSIIDYNERRKRFVEAAEKSKSDFEAYYKGNVKDFGTLYGDAIPFYLQEVVKGIEFGYRELSRYNVYIEETQYLQMVQDATHPIESLKYYTEFADNIMSDAQQKADKLAQSLLTSPQWRGGGFGLSGAVKGALSAGALSIGTDMLRGFGAAISASGQRTRYVKIMEEFYQREDHCKAFVRRIGSQWMQIVGINETILQENNLTVRPEIDSEAALVPFLKAGDLAREATAETSKDTYEKIIDLVCQGLPHDPYWAAAYVDLYSVPYTDKQEIQALATFFGVESEYNEKKTSMIGLECR